MKQFEYRHFAYCVDIKCSFHKHAEYPDFQAQLDELGRQGFELKGMGFNKDGYGSCIFGREIEPETRVDGERKLEPGL